MPRAWLTPNSPAPESERCRTISVPDDLALVGAVTGALLPLTDPDNWEAQGSMTPQQAADIMSAAFESFVASDCEGTGICPPLELPEGSKVYRINPTTLNWEYLDPEGSGEWLEPSGDEEIPTPAAREETTEDERLCNAAANAANVLKVLYDDVLDSINADLDAAQALINLSIAGASLLGSWLGGITIGMGALGEFGFNVFWEAVQGLAVNVWDAQFTENLTCILKANATDTAGVITFDFQEVNKDILAEIWGRQEYVVLVSQVIYLNMVIGPQGLNIAGTTTAVTGDCSTCGTWCFTWSGQSLLDNWTIAEGTVDSNLHINQAYQSTLYQGARYRIWLKMDNVDTSDCVITSVGIRNFAASGCGVSRYREMTALPGLDLPSPYATYNTDNGAQFQRTTDDIVNNVTTGSETDISIRLFTNCTVSNYVTEVEVRGTGTCPFGASTC